MELDHKHEEILAQRRMLYIAFRDRVKELGWSPDRQIIWTAMLDGLKSICDHPDTSTAGPSQYRITSCNVCGKERV